MELLKLNVAGGLNDKQVCGLLLQLEQHYCEHVYKSMTGPASEKQEANQ